MKSYIHVLLKFSFSPEFYKIKKNKINKEKKEKKK
jgi:hypothetical protein